MGKWMENGWKMMLEGAWEDAKMPGKMLGKRRNGGRYAGRIGCFRIFHGSAGIRSENPGVVKRLVSRHQSHGNMLGMSGGYHGKLWKMVAR